MDSSYSQLRHQISTPSFTFNPNNKFRRDYPPRSFAPAGPMNATELPLQTESVGTGVWSSPPTHTGQSTRPATIHETTFPYCIPEAFSSLPAWDSSTMPIQPLNEGISQTYAVQQNYFQSSTLGEHNWNSKSWEDGLDIPAADSEINIGQAYTTDEVLPILDLRYPGSGIDSDRLGLDQLYNSRRLSGSSYTMSSTGAFSDMPSLEDFPSTLSEAPSFSSDYPPRSNRNSLMSSTQLSPVASPRMTPQSRSELRTQSRGRASPSPRPSMRSAPYTIDSTRNKRWSTGSYAQPGRRPTSFAFHQGAESLSVHPPRVSSRHSSPTRHSTHLPLNLSNLQTQQHPFLLSSNTSFHQNGMLLPSHNFNDQHHFENQNRPLSHGLFRMLQSNADPHALHAHYTDLSEPPDLYASLRDDQVPPPPEDMNPSDPDMVPHEQELRFSGDLYTPRWVRGHGNKREGWCGICKSGRWLVLKNSAFWYDKSFTHGISAATGSPFQEPQETRRMDGNPDVWEGLCGSCNEWVALVSSKKKGTTWFRHAYKCHTHPKIKDAPKRRRESAHSRAANSASSVAKPKIETPTTPQMPPSGTVSHTRTPPGGKPPPTITNNSLEGLSGMI